MAVLDVYQAGPTSVASGAYLDLLPTGTQETIIHNIYWGPGNIEIYYYDGTNQILIYSDPTGSATGGGLFNQQFHCSNVTGKRIRIKSTSATIFIGADGVYTHA